MGRLIDTDVLEAFIKTHSCSVGTDGVLLTVGEDKIWHNLLEYIPTAYDVDKVVEELQAIKGYACLGRQCTPHCEYYKECYKGEKAEKVAIDKAIEIVKQGGVSDDVCEWHCDEYGRWHTECHILADNDPLEYTYCPYCGKKIKVVE